MIALLVFVPFVGFIMTFVLGAKGSAWAWRNKKWESVEQFQAVQRKWTKWALIVYALMIVVFIGIFFAIMAGMKDSEAYKMALAKLDASAAVEQVLGKPISAGSPMGNFKTSGNSGSAEISFSVEGPKGKGKVFLDAVKDMGEWKINRMVLEQEGTDKRIDLNE